MVNAPVYGVPSWTDSSTLGDLVSVEMFGTRYLFLNSYEAAIDLLEKRGNIYSGRPKAAMLDL